MAIGPLSFLWRWDLTCLIWYKTSSTRKRMQDAYLLPLSRNVLRNYGREFHWLHALKFTREVVA